MDWVISADYTYFEYDDWVKPDEIIRILTAPVTKKAFEYEKTILLEELSDISYGQNLYETIVKKLINPKISLNNFSDILRADAKIYHENYYIPQNIIIVDKNYKILHQWFKKLTNQPSRSDFFSFWLKFQWDKYKVIGGKNISATNYRKLYFIFWMISFYCTKIFRREKQQYYHLDTFSHSFNNYHWVVLPSVDLSEISQTFFKYWKEYIIKMFSNWYFKEKFFLNDYFYGIPMSRNEVIQMYKNLKFIDILNRDFFSNHKI